MNLSLLLIGLLVAFQGEELIEGVVVKQYSKNVSLEQSLLPKVIGAGALIY